jgi:GntR family transcriptional regulator, transcriptional repressor for pyruvate dehydrogenase complex
VAAIIGTLTEIIWETGRLNMEDLGLRGSAEIHRRIYEAIRARSPERARREMTEHLEHARWEQVKKETGDARQVQPAADRRRAHQATAQTEEEEVS